MHARWLAVSTVTPTTLRRVLCVATVALLCIDLFVRQHAVVFLRVGCFYLEVSWNVGNETIIDRNRSKFEVRAEFN